MDSTSTPGAGPLARGRRDTPWMTLDLAATGRLLGPAVPGDPGIEPAAIARVPAAAIVSVARRHSPAVLTLGLRPGATTVHVRRSALPLRHRLMLGLAFAIMVCGGVYSHRRPMLKAINVPITVMPGHAIA